MHITPHPVKDALYQQCQQYVRQRIDTARSAMEAAQESANEESKSSAGDKYETGRAMAQIERDRHAQLLAEALKLEQDLHQLDIDKPSSVVRAGSLVLTNRGRFFIAISVGKLVINGVDYFVVSPASPIGALLIGHSAGDTVTFNKMAYQLQEVA
ncbi:3-oxoacyl-ACP synthase [Arsenicibacter rosenii]|uniref:3-oxoacyl-ACP synthase n=1 Tax=Arsenicibacter rosenii TaxID=1750698 RepID=A0A1S2VJM6_9BACT|nr:3-oxoacyl-ACP synthase [Arsenicibacter rosenii]OIN58962.1 3-oxoacyl-ACP synthase [Arsenicibacter rosenii]